MDAATVGAIEMPPEDIEPFRIAGDLAIVPNDLDRVDLPVGAKARGRFQLCLDTTGTPTSVAVTNTSGIANYDRKIVDRMWKWAFNPILVDGKSTKVCSQVFVQFEQTTPVQIQRH